LNNRSYYNKVIGENAGGIYVLRFKEQDMHSGFSIERYSHNLDFIESENFELGKREKLLKVFTIDSGLVFVKSTFEKEFGKVTYLVSGFKPGNQILVREIYKGNRMERDEDHILVDYSNNRKIFSVWISERDENNNQQFQYLQNSIYGETLKRNVFNTGMPYREAEPDESVTMDNGSAALIFTRIQEDKRPTDPGAEEHFVLTLNSGNKMLVSGFGDSKFFIASLDIVANEFSQKFLISGFYDYKKPQGGHGLVTYYFTPEDSLIQGKFESFDRKFVSQLIGAKQEQDGQDPEKYFVRKLIPRDDGGYLLIGEYFDVTQQMETFYLNGVPQTSSKSVYNYNDIVLVSLDSAGSIEWRHNINKRQNSYASLSYMHSLGVYVCEHNVNLMYNDNSAQSNRVMHIRLSRDGMMEQKIILNSDNEYTAIIPMEGKQTGYNRFVTPIFQSRQTMLMQVVDDK